MNKKIIIFALLSITLLFILFLVFSSLISSKENEKTDIKEEEKEQEKEEEINKISFKKYKLNNKNILILKNKNEKNVYAEIIINYYKNDEIVDTNSQYIFSFEKDKESVIVIPTIEKEYDSFKVDIETSDSELYKAKYDIIQIESKNQEDMQQIYLNVNNKSNEEISYASIGVLFYKNNQIIGYEEDKIYNLLANSNNELNINYIIKYDGHFNLIDFDDYKIIINDSY